MHVIPYGAIGGLLSREDTSAGEEPSSHTPLLHGQAFCSLPITPTGLPVHVNGKSWARPPQICTDYMLQMSCCKRGKEEHIVNG